MSRVERQATLRADIESCIREGAFALAYQPIVYLDTGAVVGFEALCRFDDGASPERRFQQSERLGLAADLDLAIIERALGEVAAIPEGDVSVNLSASTILDDRLCDLLVDDVGRERLVIEVTEHARIPDYEKAQHQLDVLRKSGIRVAVDDAGAGYSTFQHILSLRPDLIKMDRSITHDIDSDSARRALAAALVLFGADIGATIVAEGVETSREIAALIRAGIHRAQGFAVGLPAMLPLPSLNYEPAGTEDEANARRVRARTRVQAAMASVRSAERELDTTVASARETGVSWDELADILGITRQGVSKRYRQRR
ncbi:MAG: EAL domain-containing protein [Acidimicrobiia bacterium]|nr:EAL domain-containing protein [Acidimicrobiia bacterium]MBV9042085.1 EAL domain-containing protein [Acidimicrobiia bacterium]